MEFIDALRGISNYVGEFLTLEQAKEQTISWVKANGYAGNQKGLKCPFTYLFSHKSHTFTLTAFSIVGVYFEQISYFCAFRGRRY